MINPPMKRKIIGSMYCIEVCFESRIPSNGNNIAGRRAVTATGIASVSHNEAIRTATAAIFEATVPADVKLFKIKKIVTAARIHDMTFVCDFKIGLKSVKNRDEMKGRTVRERLAPAVGGRDARRSGSSLLSMI